MVLDASLLNTQHYKVRIKGKVEQSREGVAPSPTHWCSSYRKGSLRVTLDYGRQPYLLIWPIGGALTSATTKVRVDRRVITMYRYFTFFKSSRIGSSPLGGIVSYQGHWLGWGSYDFSGLKSAYSTAPVGYGGDMPYFDTSYFFNYSLVFWA